MSLSSLSLKPGSSHLFKLDDQIVIPFETGIQVLSGNDISIITPIANTDIVEEQQQLDQSIQPHASYFMRFDRQNTNLSLQLSPSGLVCTNIDVKDAKGVAVATQGYSSGKHYWEFICPISCEGLQVGIVMKGFDINQFNPNTNCHFLEFKTSTQRTIGLKLDLDAGTLRCWLNGNYNEKKYVGLTGPTIAPGVWYPVVTVRGTGNQIVLNPFAKDPEGQLDDLVSNLRFIFQSLLAPSKSDEELFAGTDTLSLDSLKPASFELGVVGSNLLIQQNQSLKLFQLSKDQFLGNPYVIYNDTRQAHDYVTLQLDTHDYETLLKYLQGSELLYLQSFLQQLNQGKRLQEFYVFRTTFAAGRTVFQEVVHDLQGIIRQQNKAIQAAEVELNKKEVPSSAPIVEDQALKQLQQLMGVSEESKQSASEEVSKKEYKLSIEEAYYLLTIVLNLDEQLQASALGRGSKPFLHTLRHQNRIFTAFARLDTLSVADPLQLTEQGFFKRPGGGYSHFLNPNVEIDLPVDRTYFPDNRMFQGRPCGNVDLRTTINNLPALTVAPGKLLPSQGPFFGVERDDTVTLYNGEIQLFQAGSVNLRQFQVAKQAGSVPATNPLQQAQQPAVSDIFKILENYSTCLKDVLPPHPPEQDETDYAQLFQEAPEMILDEDVLQQLHNMGFPLTVCKKALQRTNNEGLDKALDVIFDIQKEEIAKPAQGSIKKQTLKPEWQCKSCTLLNGSPLEVCDACGEPAPPDAYFVETEHKQPVKEPETQVPEPLPQVVVDIRTQLSDPQQSTVVGNSLVHEAFSLASLYNSSEDGQAALVVRKLRYNHLTENFFQPLEKSNLDRGYVCTITNQWVPGPLTSKVVKQTLLSEPNTHFIVRAVYPVFHANKAELNYLEVSSETIIPFPAASKIQSFSYAKTATGVYYFTVVSGREQNQIQTSSTLYVHLIKGGKAHLAHEVGLPHGSTYLSAYASNSGLECVFSDGSQLTQLKQYIHTSRRLQDQTFIKHDFGSGQIVDLKADSRELNAIVLDGQSSRLVQLVHPTQQLHETDMQCIPAEFVVHRTPNQQTLKLTAPGPLIDLNFDVVVPFRNAAIAQLQQSQLAQPKRYFNRTLSQIDHEPTHLPLTIHSFTGSQFNLKMLVTKFLYPNEGPFTPNYPHAEFVLRHLHGKRMNIATVTVNSDIKNHNCGFPIGSGLIFTADHPNQFRQSTHFEGMEMAQYRQWQQLRKQQPQPIQAWEPVGCFEFEESNESVTITLDVQRPCNYVFLKPTNFRRKPYDNTMHFNKNPLEIKYFQWYTQCLMFSKGTEVNEPAQQVDEGYFNEQTELVETFLKSVKLEIRFADSQQFQPFAMEGSIAARETLVDQLSVYTPQQQLQALTKLHGVPLDSSLQVRLRHADLQNKAVAELRVTYDALRSISIRATKPKHNFSLQEDNKLVGCITSPVLTFGQRVEAITLLTKLVSLDQNAQTQTFAELDFTAYIQLNLLHIEDDAQERSVVLLLAAYESQPNFQSRLLEAIERALDSPASATHRGLNNWIHMLRGVGEVAPDRILSLLTDHFNRCLATLEKSKQKYQHLRSLGLQGSYFDDGVLVQPNSEPQLQTAEPALASRIIQQTTKNQQQIRTFTIDLQKVHNLSRLGLRFLQHDKTMVRFRVQVWTCSETNKRLIIDDSQGEWTFTQVAQFAFKHAEKDGELLGYPISVSARYLQVQVCFGTTALVRREVDTANFPPKQVAIIPEVWGEATNEPGTIAYYQQQFEEFQQGESTSVLNYKTYVMGTQLLLDSTQTIKKLTTKQHQTKDSTNLNENRSQLRQLQIELTSKLDQNAPAPQLVSLCTQISTLHNAIAEDDPLVSTLSTAFQYAYCYQITSLLSDLHYRNPRSQETLSITRKVFYGILEEEEGPLVTQARRFLSEQLIDELAEKDWILFVLQALEHQRPEALQRNFTVIPVPLRHTLRYLGTHLNSEEKVQALLQILVGWYKQAPTYLVGQDQKIESKYRNLRPLNPSPADPNEEGASLYNQLLEQTTEDLQIAFDVCVWVSQHPNEVLFSLAVDLLIELVRISPAAKVAPLFTSNVGLSNLVAKILFVGYNNKLLLLLENLFTIRELPERYNQLQAVLLLEQPLKDQVIGEREQISLVRKSIVSTIQQLLSDLVDHNFKAQSDFNLTSQQWLEHLQFLIDFLAYSVTILNTDLANNATRDHKGHRTPTQKIAFCSSQTVNQLVQLIRGKEKSLHYDFQEFVLCNSLWSLVLRVVLRISPFRIREECIFERVVEAFLCVRDEVKQTMFSELLTLTSNLLQHNPHRELSRIVLGVLLDTVEYFLLEGLAIHYNLIRGWLSILQPIKTATSLKIHYASDTGVLLLKFIANYLFVHGQFGGRDGVQLASVETLQRLEIAESLLQMFVNSVDDNEQPLQLPTDSATFIKLIQWSIVNTTTEAPNSPSQEYIRSISDLVFKVYERVPPQFAASCLTDLFNCQEQVDNIVLPLIQRERLAVQFGYGIVVRSLKLFEDLFNMWLVNDEVARHVALNFFDYLLSKVNSKPAPNEEELREEELASELAIVNLAGQTATAPLDWSTHKKGSKTRIALLQMNGVWQEEYQLVLKLKSLSEIKDITLGFQTFTTDFTDKVLGCPSSVHVEVSNDQSIFVPIGRLNLIDDESYTNNCIKVFSKNNLLSLSRAASLESYLNSLQHKRVQYIKFRIRRPIITFIEANPQLNARNYRNVALGISFLSIRGHSVSNLPADLPTLIAKRQERTALTLIGKLCQPRYTATLAAISNSPAILEKVKHSFDRLLASLETYESQITPLLLAISPLADWILDQLLNTQHELVHARLVTEIVLRDPTERVPKLHKFVITSLLQGDHIRSAPFIDSYCTSLLASAKNLQIDSMLQVQLPLTIQQLHAIIAIYEKVHQTVVAKLLIKLIVLLTYMPFPYQLEEDLATVDYVWERAMSFERPYMLELLAPLVIGSEASVDWFVSSERLGVVVRQLQQSQVPSILWFLNALSQIPKCTQSMADHLLTIYGSVVNAKNGQLIGQLDTEQLALFTSFVSNVIQNHPQMQPILVTRLIEDIRRLSEINDMRFVTLVLVPLLNSERVVSVCLNFWDPIAKKFITDPRKLVTQARKGTLASLLNNCQETEQADNESPPAEVSEVQLGDEQWELLAGNALQQVLRRAKFLIIGKAVHDDQVVRFSVRYDSTSAEEDDTGTCLNMPNSDKSFVYLYDTKQKVSVIGPLFAQAFLLEDDTMLTVTHEPQFSVCITLQYPATLHLDGVEHLIKDLEYYGVRTPVPKPTTSKFVSLTGSILEGLSQSSTNMSSITTLGYGGLSQLTFSPAYFKGDSPYNYFRATPTYALPGHLTLDKLPELIAINSMTVQSELLLQTPLSTDASLKLHGLHRLATNMLNKTNGIVDIEVDALELIEALVQGTSAPQQTASQELSIFHIFEQQDGVKAIIKVVQDGIKKWKNTARAQAWSVFIDELWSFCFLPSFFNQFMKNKACVDLLFQLLAGAPDDGDQKKWDEQQQTAVKFIYQTLIEVFRNQNTSQVRELALEKDLLARILDRIALVSKEKKRHWLDQLEKEELASSPEKVKPDEPEGKKKPIKKKGIGYASDNIGQNAKWNTQEYVDNKNLRNEQLCSLLAIIEQFFDYPNWHIPPQVADKLMKIVYESALLPLLEAAFRSGSLLEMAKEADLYKAYMRLVIAIAKHRVLAPIFLDLPRNYVPQQVDSLQTLLTNLRGNANIYLNCMQSSNVDEKSQSSQAQMIMEAYTAMDHAISKYQLNQSDSEQEDIGAEERELREQEAANELIKEILQKPLPEAYRLLLQDLRFDYVSMKENNRYKHHYHSSIQTNYTPPQSKQVRLAQEFADMSTALPIEHTNAIFCRADKDRADVMKAMVMGAKGSPYANGAFVFDIYFDDNYPNGPPKMNLSTTGAGKVRFNPNLYSCGKVCLSLLGTWRGNAAENWDAKISTLLQVLVSTQAIVMSEEVYFNEPGFEQEAGTDEGERKNEAYSNIVRYCNVKFAMIEAIRNPPKGFESVVKRHFYLKQHEILEECQQWIKLAATREASYTGLINDHNSNWCNEFKSSKTKYHDMLVEAVKQLEAEFKKLDPPAAKDLQGSKLLSKVKRQRSPKKPRNVDIKEGMANLDEVDVADDTVQVHRDLNVQDESVRDRWSRYIGAMGLDAVQKQAAATVFLSGLGPLGVEITKNVVLSGVKRFTIHDYNVVRRSDLSGQFFVTENDIGKNRALSSLEKIQQLNYYVRVDAQQCDQALPSTEAEIEQLFPTLSTYQAIIFAQSYPNAVMLAWSAFCRKHKIKFIVSSVEGLFARLINDFGEEFEVLDKNGEQGNEVMVKEISNSNPGRVDLLSKHDFEDDDMVVIHHVQGMLRTVPDPKLPPSINDTVHKIKVIDKNSFFIEDTTIYSDFLRNGTVKIVKLPIKVKFEPLADVLLSKAPPFDQTLLLSDFMKTDSPNFAHLAYQTLNTLVPRPWNAEDAKQFAAVATDQPAIDFLTKFALVCQAGEFAPLSAFFGGFVAQELIKALTNKFMPVRQVFYTDCIELLPESAPKAESGLASLIGEDLAVKLADAKVFMVGCGAIGCELLKNFAMLNIGTGDGRITITDPDHIETSNLNRQFLFREKHIHKPKSQTAAAAVIHMNPALKGKIVARLDKVFEGSENVFTDRFFEQLTIVANALDNVQARRYVDRRCVSAKVPLLESGTLGPKGHVQVIVPFHTESYGSSNDPVEDGEIPYCTLKMFPEETLHCIEFARDKFGKLFTVRPKSIMKILEEPKYIPTSPEELKELRQAVKIVKNVPANYEACVFWARRKFQKYFVNDIKQLLFTYPLDHKTKEGKLFWTMPKRPPQPNEYDLSNPLHVQFVSTLAYLRARLFNIPFESTWRQPAMRQKVAELALTCVVPEWVPSEEKKQSISSEVQKNQAPDPQELQQQEAPSQSFDQEQEQLLNELGLLRGRIPSDTKTPFLLSDEFEKDNDQNGHIDFMHAFGNLRAANYKLDEMDWLTVKIKAGRIVPALATTTAVVAGLQTIELCKTIKQCKIEHLKNAFINLAIPYVQLTEPGAAQKVKLTESLTVTLWDRWDHKMNRNSTLKDLFDLLEATYKLTPVNLFLKSAPIYMAAVLEKKEKEKQQLLASKLVNLLNVESDEPYVDLNINFSRQGESEILQGVPLVRVIFE